ncbi:MAG: cyclic nucleotide-binding domain-containing protein [Rhodospirillales bacterium]
MNYNQAVSVLRGIPVFAPLDTASLKLLAFSSIYLSFEQGEALCHQGDPGDSVFVVHEGEVDVSPHSQGHRPHPPRAARPQRYLRRDGGAVQSAAHRRCSMHAAR